MNILFFMLYLKLILNTRKLIQLVVITGVCSELSNEGLADSRINNK